MIFVALAAYVALGLPEGALGVGWPTMRHSFGQPLSSLGVIAVTFTAGYLASSAATGRVVARVGGGTAMTGAWAAASIGAAAWAAAPAWWVVLVAALLVGVGLGPVDAALNAHLAIRGDARGLNLIHACFGVGATLSPLLMAGLLRADHSWRVMYLVLAAVNGCLVVASFATRRGWASAPVVGQDMGTERTSPRSAAARPAGRAGVALGLGIFFLYTCVEVGMGQWAYVVLTDHRDVATGTAALAVSAYWGALTAGRLALGLAGLRAAPRSVLDVSVAGALTSTVAFWLLPTPLAICALPLAGLSLAGMFPALVALTPERVGPDRATSVIGYQIAAAGLGGAAGPGAAAVAVGVIGLASVPPLLLAFVGVFAALHLVARDRAPSLLEGSVRTES